MYIYLERRPIAQQTGGQGAGRDWVHWLRLEVLGPDSLPLFPTSSPNLDPASYPDGPASSFVPPASKGLASLVRPPSHWPCLLSASKGLVSFPLALPSPLCLLPQKALPHWSGLLPKGPASCLKRPCPNDPASSFVPPASKGLAPMALPPPLCLLPPKAWPHCSGLLPNGPIWLFFGRISKTGGKLNSSADCISNSNCRERALAQM
ncbi:hypothetical protein EYF80_046353 [Liparis tanakae]|uniref:Uncharacterized protein n=1 Tax=Liparis tanakae TaxID=230148 RepID=A0A4Z2FRC0_9TELE|nr:hypothetical protein EYF80_046353 [Liparis tanakae]